MPVKFQFRRDSNTNWSNSNPVLTDGEFGYDKTTKQFKIGDGTTAWNTLNYVGTQGVQGTTGVDGTTNASSLTSGTLAAARLPQLTSFQVLDANNGVVLSGSEGAIELFRQDGLAFIDFKDLSTDDYDCRIQQQANGLSFSTGGNGSTTERIRFKSNGQIRLVPLSSDPGGAEDGDVYYNSTFNSLRTRSNGSWSNLTSNFVRSETGAETRTIEAKLRDTVCVFDFMTAAEISDVTSFTGSVDVRQAIQDAVTAARGKTLYFPAGAYFINPANGSILLEEVTIRGEGVLDGANDRVNENEINILDRGSIFRIASTGSTTVPFKIRRGVTLDGVAWYHNGQTGSGAPVTYAPTLEFDHTNGPVQFVYIQNCVAYNSWRWLNIGGEFNDGGVGHIWITNNTVCGISRAIEIGYNREVIKIIGNTFAFGHWNKAEDTVASDPGVAAYMRGSSGAAGAVAVYYVKGDGIWFTNNLVFGYKAGILMEANALTQLCTIADNFFDQVRYCIAATGSGANCNFLKSQIVGNNFLAYNATDQTLDGICIILGSSGASITEHIVITGNVFSNAAEDAIRLQGSNARRLVVNGNSFSGLAAFKQSGTYYCVSVASNAANTDLLFIGNTVHQDNPAHAGGLFVANGTSISVVGNDFRSCREVVKVTACDNLFMSSNRSAFTNSETSDSISGVRGRTHQVGNIWDKPSGSVGKPQVLARKSSSQTFNSANATDVIFATEVYDKGGDFSSPTFTAPTALGKQRYRFTLGLLHDNTGIAGDRWQILLSTTSGILAWSYKMIADYNSISYSGEIELNGGDTAKWQIQRVGGTGNFVTFDDSNANYMTASILD